MHRSAVVGVLAVLSGACHAQSPEIEAFIHCEVEQSAAYDLHGACSLEERPLFCLMPDVLLIASDDVIGQLRAVIQARRDVVTGALGVSSTAEIASLPQDQACALVRSQISDGEPLGQLLDGLASE